MGKATIRSSLGSRKPGTSKLNEADVREIRASLMTREKLAQRYGVKESTIKEVQIGRTWVGVK